MTPLNTAIWKEVEIKPHVGWFCLIQWETLPIKEWMDPCILTFIIYCYFFGQAFLCLLGSLTILIKQMQIKTDLKKNRVKTSPETKQKSLKPTWVPFTWVLLPTHAMSYPVCFPSQPCLTGHSTHLISSCETKWCIMPGSLLFSIYAPFSYIDSKLKID